MNATCIQCGKPFTAQRSSAKYCGSSCRARASAAKKDGFTPQVTVIEGSGTTALTDATRSELTAAGLVDTADGILLLTLAARIDAVPETSPALASLSKEYAARKTETFSGATAVVDPFDELQAARERRRAN